MACVAEKSLIRFKFVPDFRLYVNRVTHIEYLDNFPILSLRPEPLEDMGNGIKKRMIDITFSLLVIVFLLSWLVPILAILVKLSSRGPVFFTQIRSGKNNKQFICFKLRTLNVNNESNTKQVTINDARITTVWYQGKSKSKCKHRHDLERLCPQPKHSFLCCSRKTIFHRTECACKASCAWPCLGIRSRLDLHR